MALKYEIEYFDTVNILHRFELYDDDYVGSPIEVQGSVTLDYGQVSENLESIRGQGLRVDLEANTNLTFEDLFTENQKTFSVIYKRDSVILFNGWLNPDGFYENFVSDSWIVSFDCVDGLGYLKDLAFVDDSGLNIVGIKTQLELLSIALKRTGIQQNINVSIEIYYTGLSDTLSVLENVKARSERYIKDDKGTIMSCEEVIRDILETYGAVLTSYNGEWVIYKPNQLFNDTTQTFFRYDYEGVALSPSTVDFDFSLNIGSQLDGFYPHYCNANQQFTNISSYGAYRINYKYGFLENLIDNQLLETSDGTTVDDFVIIDGTRITLGAPGSTGVDFAAQPFSFGANVKEFRNSALTLPAGSIVNFFMDVSFLNNSGLNTFVRMSYSIELDDGVDTYYLNENSIWVPNISSTFNRHIDDGTTATIRKTSRATPVAGDLTVVIKTFRYDVVDFGYNTATLSFFNITTEPQDASGIEGDIFTFERTDNPSARIPSKKEVFTGDGVFEIYNGTLYKADGTTPTETWYRKNVTESLPILEIMGSETMRMNANTMRIFSGDIYGYFNYLSVFSIDQKSGVYGVTKYSYDTKNNIVSVEVKQLFGDELTDLEVVKTFDFGEVVTPTIKS